MQRTINDPALNITADSVLVLRNAYPKGGPGMPEYGMLPLPDHLLKQGVRDMVRISDARMSGTSYGACVLHVAPESYVGGPLALVRTGDLITLDVENRSLTLDVDDEELGRRRAEDAAARTLRTRLRRALQRPDHPGRHRLRLRVPRPAGRRPGPVRGLTRPPGRNRPRTPVQKALPVKRRKDRAPPRPSIAPHRLPAQAPRTARRTEKRRTVMAQAAAVAKPPAPPRRRRASATPRRLPYLLIAPAALLMLGFIAYPVLSVFYYSLQDYNPTKPWRNGFAGFGNFTRIFTDDPLRDTLVFSAKWVFVEVGLQLLFGLALALIVNQTFVGRALGRALVFPWAVSGVLTSAIWVLLYNSQTGITRYLADMGVGEYGVSWLSDTSTVFPAAIVADL